MEIYSEKLDKKYTLIEWCLTLMIYSIALVLSSKIFTDFYVQNFSYALVTSIVILFLNKTIKPILQLLTLPITIMTLGVLYPLLDVCILKIASRIMGDHFIVVGWFVPFFIAIFIGIITLFLDATITKVIVGGKK